jgi:Pyridoxal-phosphate dependent enzyme
MPSTLSHLECSGPTRRKVFDCSVRHNLCAACRSPLFARYDLAAIAMPSDTPSANVIESRAFGADVHLIDGVISDCGKYIAEHAATNGWFEVSTLKEPYRIEGEKMMGYELWEDFGGKLPDVIVYPPAEAVRRSSGPSSNRRRHPSTGTMRRPWLRACVCPKRSATSWSSPRPKRAQGWSRYRSL